MKFAWFLGLLFAASPCFAQMFTLTDLGTLGGSESYAVGINDSGQVVGWASISGNTATHAFRTAPNRPINPATDDIGSLGGESSLWLSRGINASAQVVGNSEGFFTHAFRTAPNRPINPATDDIGSLGGPITEALGINDSGQAVGESLIIGAPIPLTFHAFRTAPNRPINPATDDLGTLGGLGGDESSASGINDSGQVAGWATTGGKVHAFRTAANSPINPATDDIGTLGGVNSEALGINAFGQVVGRAYTAGDSAFHAFRTAPNRPINPATDDIGTLGGGGSEALGINAFGQVVGDSLITGNTASHGFLYNGGVMHDFNNLILAGSACEVDLATSINDSGQIAANGNCSGQGHAVRLDPIYEAFVQQPINADGSSVFNAKRGVLPVKFTLTQYDAPTCTLLPATISVTRASGGTLASVDASIYLTPADDGSNFRIAGCHYHYNLAARSLGVGTYRVDISINGIFVGHAVFAIKQACRGARCIAAK